MKFRILIEIELSDGASADDAIMWAQALVDMAKGRFKDGSERPFHPYHPRVVSATPVSEKR